MFWHLRHGRLGETHPPLEKDGRITVLTPPRHHFGYQYKTNIKRVAEYRETELRDFINAAVLRARKAVEQASDGHNVNVLEFQAGPGFLRAAARNELILPSVIAVSRISVSDSANPAIAEAGNLTKR